MKWFEYPELRDGSFAGKDFMSLDIASPMQLDATGIWLNILVNTAPGSCSLGSPGVGGSNVSSLAVLIDGVSSTALVVLAVVPGFRGGEGLVGVTGPIVMHNGWCYSFGFLTRSVEVTQLHTAEVQHIYSSFRFNR
jgi:hypothetical protein